MTVSCNSGVIIIFVTFDLRECSVILMKAIVLLRKMLKTPKHKNILIFYIYLYIKMFM